MRYRHTQWGSLPLLVLPLVAIAVVLLGPLGEASESPVAFYVLASLVPVAAVVLGLFSSLTVAFEGRELLVHFGPLPWIRRRIPLDDLREWRAGRSSLIDGWGIHWHPTRGWIWNVWGFDCVELEFRDGRRFRIGTNDVEGLLAALEDRLEGRSAAAGRGGEGAGPRAPLH